ncbi:hypothetical protein [Hyphomonas sp.]|uniref:hypothetical protein n=1 Tax=Hyphomonas sp. TaxID=87 RepID=UPI0030F80003
MKQGKFSDQQIGGILKQHVASSAPRRRHIGIDRIAFMMAVSGSACARSRQGMHLHRSEQDSPVCSRLERSASNA